MTTPIKIINQENPLKDQLEEDQKTIFIIKDNCTLNGNVRIDNGSILKFDFDLSNTSSPSKGFISGVGTISGNFIIDAPKSIQIFDENVNIQGIVNEEISAHWFGAKGDGTTDDTNAIQKALNSSESAFVVLENLTYKTENTIIINDNKRLRCKGSILSSADVAIDLIGSDIELDITELKSSNANYESGVDTYQGTGVLFSGNVWNSKISIDNILFFKTAIGLVPTIKEEEIYNDSKNYIGIQYCQISWLYIRAMYGIYFDLGNIKYKELPTFRTWINENQFNGGRLYCQYGIYSEKVCTNLITTTKNVAVMNGNVFNSVAFEGSQASESNQILCKAITLSNASHSNFNDIRLSEGYIRLENPYDSWIELDRCSYLRFTFKSLIPYKAVNAQRCNNIRIEAQICDNGLGNNSNYDCLHIINSNSEFNPLKKDCEAYATHIFASRHMVPSQEFKRIYVGSNGSQSSHVVEAMNLEDLYKVTQGEITTFSDKCYISVCDNSTLNVSMTNNSEKLSFNLPLMLICRILPGSEINLNSPEKGYTITQSGLYYIRPIGDTFEICAYTYNPETNIPETIVLNESSPESGVE